MGPEKGALSAKSKPKTWKQNPEAVKKNILEVSAAEFSERGYDGARINHIAELTATSKRMLYYYFGDKRGLYRATLLNAYENAKAMDHDVAVDELSATEALRQLVAKTFENRLALDGFTRLIAGENLRRGECVEQLSEFREINRPTIDLIRKVYARGVETGEFRSGVDPLALLWFVLAPATFNVSNQHTFSAAWGDQLGTTSGQKMLCDMAVRSVLSLVVEGSENE